MGSDRVHRNEPEPARPTWSIAIMCYNERDALAEVIERTLAMLRNATPSFEIVIVDDGSTDGSGALADRLAAADPAVRVVHHQGNQGIGAALISGYRQTRGEFVAILPADLQFAPEDLPAAMSRVLEYDVVNIGRERRHDSWRRKLISSVDEMLVRILFGLKVKDLHWIKVYRRWVLDSLEIQSRTPLIDTELLVKSKMLGARLLQMPLPHHPRLKGEAKGATWRNLIGTFLDLFRLRLNLIRPVRTSHF